MDGRLFRFDLGMYTEELGEEVGERPDSRIFLRAAVGI